MIEMICRVKTLQNSFWIMTLQRIIRSRKIKAIAADEVEYYIIL